MLDQDIALKHRIGMVHHRRLLLAAGDAMDQNRAGQERKTEERGGSESPWLKWLHYIGKRCWRKEVCGPEKFRVGNGV